MVSYIGLIVWWIEIRYSIDNGYKGVAYKGYYAPFKLRYGWEETKIRNKASLIIIAFHEIISFRIK